MTDTRSTREVAVDRMIADGRLDPANRDLVLGFAPGEIAEEWQRDHALRVTSDRVARAARLRAADRRMSPRQHRRDY